MKIKKGDTVEVISGDDKGVRAVTVHSCRCPARAAGIVVVAGVNMIKKHQRPTGDVRTQVGHHRARSADAHFQCGPGVPALPEAHSRWLSGGARMAASRASAASARRPLTRSAIGR